MQLVGQRVPRSHLLEIATLFHTVCWEFPDYGLKSYFLVSDSGEVWSAADWTGAVDGVVTLDARTFHDVAFGNVSLGMAFFLGRLRVTGIPVAKLGKAMLLLDPFLESYRLACQELAEKPG